MPTPPDTYRGAADWKLAQPADELGRGTWWGLYRDSTLDELESRVDASNQGLKAALARLQQARAQTRIARSAFFPTLTADASAQHYRNSLEAPTHTAATPTVTSDLPLNVDLSYEADVWGRIRNSVAAARSGERASAADLAVLSLATHAELASDYFVLRGADTEQQILDQTVVDFA